MYELVFDGEPTTLDHPAAFTPASAEVGLVVASPGGQTARVSLMGVGDADEDALSRELSEALSAISSAPIRVFPLAQAGAGESYAQAYGPHGSVLIAYSKGWSADMPHPPPRREAEVEIEIDGPSEAGAGVWALGTELRGTLIDAGRRIPGVIVVSTADFLFRPSARAGIHGPSHCRFRAVFCEVRNTHWELRCQATGVFTSGAQRGRALWVHSADRLGLRVEVDAPPVRPGAPAQDDTVTVETGTMSVDPEQIEGVDDDATVMLRRPE